MKSPPTGPSQADLLRMLKQAAEYQAPHVVECYQRERAASDAIQAFLDNCKEYQRLLKIHDKCESYQTGRDWRDRWGQRRQEVRLLIYAKGVTPRVVKRVDQLLLDMGVNKADL